MIKTSVADAKARLSEYLERAERGERVIICRHNKPIAELRAVEETRAEPRPVGPLPGRPTFEVPAAFFEPLPDDELELWDSTAVNPASARVAPRVAESSAIFKATSKRVRQRRRT
jgi:prevent-host-death family protein